MSIRKSIIHSDFTSSNLIFSKGKIIAVLDWDNLRKDYLVSEPSIALGHIITLNKEVELNLIRSFLHEYEKQILLNNEEKKALYFFIKNKILGGIVWCDLQRKSHPSKAKIFKKWLIGLIVFYKKFDKITLNEFLKVVNN
jgi:Ser/Thr protein kinase RdoA (MazF antagonist)